MHLGAKLIHTTKIQENTQNPRWDEDFELPLELLSNKDKNMLIFSIYDKDDFGGDQLLASQLIPCFLLTQKKEEPKQIMIKMNNSDPFRNTAN